MNNPNDKSNNRIFVKDLHKVSIITIAIRIIIIATNHHFIYAYPNQVSGDYFWNLMRVGLLNLPASFPVTLQNLTKYVRIGQVSGLPQNFKSSDLNSCTFVLVPNSQTSMEPIVTNMFHIFLHSLVRSWYFHSFSPSSSP